MSADIKTNLEPIENALGEVAYYLKRYGEVRLSRFNENILTHSPDGFEPDALICGQLMHLILNHINLDEYLMENKSVIGLPDLAIEMLSFMKNNKPSDYMRFTLDILEMDDFNVIEVLEGDYNV